MPTPSSRIHEPLALAALFAAGVSLHLLWMGNLLALRLVPVGEALDFLPSIGPMSGLYAIVAAAYVLTFAVVAVVFRGRDCTSAREGAFWFFVSAVIAFAVLTLPFVAGFGVTA